MLEERSGRPETHVAKFLAWLSTASADRDTQGPTLQISMLIFPLLIGSPQILFVNGEIDAAPKKKKKALILLQKREENGRFPPWFWCIRSS